MKRTPVVGVTTSLGGGRYMWWFYWLSLRLFGVRPIRLTAPGGAGVLKRLDGLVVGGGDDISAEIYKGEAALDIRIDPARDRLELLALEEAAKRDIPVLGVCRGAQMLNVFEGGTLHQDIRRAYEGVPAMWSPLPRKMVTVEEGSKLSSVMKSRKFRANSLHRQSIDRLGRGLSVCAHDRYGIVQGVEDRTARFRIGVQWHPEFMIYRRAQRRLFQAFARAVRERMEER
ncbi:type 1 glutamine amidotransferase [Rhizobiales bacterium]|uniref:gamma-glutamyl-gamma-aminobutyrate hydrolase family protein n=1 Tax=Hongsoonwoonella zoysiae TaxID=2821844 RepID=UPI0015600DF5|nr:type 1 glutamine amidotransferase [Hongsoonwoonella zoysiae]NRG17654.1 type 1 glutamine amidotransferase [Hongsoonwoonella zoysiae]